VDFIEGLPHSGSPSCILVIVDKFTKFSHFIALAHPYTVGSVASVFMDVVYKLHGLSAVIISDHVAIFTSRFCQQLFKLSGTKLQMSSSYHPQTYGQTKWLSAAKFWYNMSFHSAVGRSPFEALFNRRPRVLGITPELAAAGNLDEWLHERSKMS
jgi:hypothetical protein